MSSLLERTFIHLPGVGPVLERRLWSAGVRSWDDLAAAGKLPGVSAARRRDWLDRLAESRRRLAEPLYWRGVLPAREHWRLFELFRERTLYLDIETTGLSADHGDQVTLIGLYYQGRYRGFVQGFRLEEADDLLGRADILVTFNGACFDVPFLQRSMRRLSWPPIHLDLRYLLKRLGFSGGLKNIEAAFGLARPDEIRGMSGLDAVWLWRDYLLGDKAALGRLIKYNRADTVNLASLMETAHARLAEEITRVDRA